MLAPAEVGGNAVTTCQRAVAKGHGMPEVIGLQSLICGIAFGEPLHKW
jgi:hypothetical protein